VFWTERDRGSLLINAILQSWLRCDMLVVSEARFRRQPQDTVVPLLDREEIFASLPAHSERPKVDPQHLLGLINEFLRILGLLAVAMGRAEYPNGVVGVGHLRNLLIALMIEERNPLHRGGALHLNRLLDPQQLAVLSALPAIEATRESVIAGHLAYADAFLPRARRMAAAHSVDWPTVFEAATWAYLERELGLKRGAAIESRML